MSDTDADVEKLLNELEVEERLVSSRRRKLHERMAIFPDETGELARHEQELSKQRRELHRRIDELREQRTTLRQEEADSTQ